MTENLGWIKLYRKLLHSPIFSSEKGLKVWVWCLLKASHGGYEQYVGRTLVRLQPGQFVFGRKVAAGELRMKQSTVWDWISQLKSDSYIDIKPQSKYSVISVKNWSEYQGNDSKSDNKATTDQQQTDTNKNDKNVKNNIYSSRKCLEGKIGDDLCLEIANQYSIDVLPVKKLKTNLIGYCDQNGKRYKNYKATLQNWVRRAIDEKKITKVIKNEVPDLPPISEEQRQQNIKKIAEIKNKFSGGLAV